MLQNCHSFATKSHVLWQNCAAPKFCYKIGTILLQNSWFCGKIGRGGGFYSKIGKSVGILLQNCGLAVGLGGRSGGGQRARYTPSPLGGVERVGRGDASRTPTSPVPSPIP